MLNDLMKSFNSNIKPVIGNTTLTLHVYNVTILHQYYEEIIIPNN